MRDGYLLPALSHLWQLTRMFCDILLADDDDGDYSTTVPIQKHVFGIVIATYRLLHVSTCDTEL